MRRPDARLPRRTASAAMLCQERVARPLGTSSKGCPLEGLHLGPHSPEPQAKLGH